MPEEAGVVWLPREIDANAIRAGVVRIDTSINADGAEVVEWINRNGNVVQHQEDGRVLWGTITADNSDQLYRDYVTVGRSNILNGPVVYADVDDWDNWRLVDNYDQNADRIFVHGEYAPNISAEEPDIKDERGGALDEFIDGLKPQENTPERSDE